MGINTEVMISGFQFKNPVMPASGTFGFGREIAALYDLSILGGIVSKGITRMPRKGNEPCRVAETPSGMLNSVGLQNPGVENFIRNESAFFASQGCVSIVNIAGSSIEEYAEIAQLLNDAPCNIIELNLSCPNVKEGCMAFGSNPHSVQEVVRSVKMVTDKPLWVKLTPNTTDIVSAAKAAESEGASAVSLINTLLGMAIDLLSRRPVIHNNYAGLSGPAVKPVALRMVNEVFNNVSIPVIGMGGIMCAEDVMEFMMAGAAAVQIGSANLVDPYACHDIIMNLPAIASKFGFTSLVDVTGSVKLW
ncbi:MAG: dihydroorotate dehydrogenase [Saccharofermentanales bacterium]